MRAALTAVIILAIAAAGYHFLKKDKGPREISANGFIIMPWVETKDPEAVIIVTPKNAAPEGAKRAWALAGELSKLGLKHVMTTGVKFKFMEQPDQATIAKLDRVMGSEPPIVFVRDRARSNPAAAEVAAEFRSGGP